MKAMIACRPDNMRLRKHFDCFVVVILPSPIFHVRHQPDQLYVVIECDDGRRSLPVAIVRRNGKLIGSGRRRRAHRDIAAFRRLFRNREADLYVIGNRLPVWRVVDIHGDVRPRRN